MLRTQIAAVIGCARGNALDEIMREVWTRYSAGQLSEIEAVCDHLVIIRFGELVFAKAMAEMMKQKKIDIAEIEAAVRAAA